MQKGGDEMRLYDLWFAVFSPSSYAGDGLAEILTGFGMVGIYTLVVIGISAVTGWLIAAIVGSLQVMIRKRK
jgi:hypothetical protein